MCHHMSQHGSAAASQSTTAAAAAVMYRQQVSKADEERRKTNARKALEARQRAKKHEEDLRRDLAAITKEVQELRAEEAQRAQVIEHLQSQLAGYGDSLPTTGDDDWSPGLHHSQAAINELFSDSSLPETASIHEDLSESSLGSYLANYLPENLPGSSLWVSTSDPPLVSPLVVSSDSHDPPLHTPTTDDSLPWHPRPGTSRQYTDLQTPDLSPLTLTDTSALLLDPPHAYPDLGMPTPSHQTIGDTDVLETAETASGRRSSARRKKKNKDFSYLWPPQEDDQREAKRQRAIKAYQKRQLTKSQNLELLQDFQRVQEEVQSLRSEKGRLETHLEMLETQLEEARSESG